MRRKEVISSVSPHLSPSLPLSFSFFFFPRSLKFQSLASRPYIYFSHCFCLKSSSLLIYLNSLLSNLRDQLSLVRFSPSNLSSSSLLSSSRFFSLPSLFIILLSVVYRLPSFIPFRHLSVSFFIPPVFVFFFSLPFYYFFFSFQSVPLSMILLYSVHSSLRPFFLLFL